MEKVERILRPKDVREMLGIPEGSFRHFLIKHPSFPKPFLLGANRKGYLLSEVQEFIYKLAEKREDH